MVMGVTVNYREISVLGHERVNKASHKLEREIIESKRVIWVGAGKGCVNPELERKMNENFL